MRTTLAVSLRPIALGSVCAIPALQPISAKIVWTPQREADEKNRVTSSGGRRELWTHGGGCKLARVSRSGLVGWTYGTAVHRTQGVLMNGTLVIAREKKIIGRIEAGNAFIEVWDFADDDRSVIIVSAGAHGPRDIEKVRISTGELLGRCDQTRIEHCPAWAKRFVERARREGTPLD